MHGDESLLASFAELFSDGVPPGVEALIFPPATLLGSAAAGKLRDAGVGLGAQNVHWERQGAFTGEVSSLMVKAAGCSHVLVGHSERRTLFAETDEIVARKYAAVRSSALEPLLCVGETHAQRQAGETEAVLDNQLQAALKGEEDAEVVTCCVAYEPVWAIGSGVAADPWQAQEAHAHIASWFAKNLGLSRSALHILYGGSVKADNASSLLTMEDVDGLLVGGASLIPEEFAEILKAASSSADFN